MSDRVLDFWKRAPEDQFDMLSTMLPFFDAFNEPAHGNSENQLVFKSIPPLPRKTEAEA